MADKPIEEMSLKEMVANGVMTEAELENYLEFWRILIRWDREAKEKAAKEASGAASPPCAPSKTHESAT